VTPELRRSDRGGGIHVRGGFRIRDFRLSFDSATGELVDSSMITEVRTDTFSHWLGIAAEAADAADAARIEAVAADREDNEAFSAALEREFRASLIAVAAAAFAIDAFYGSVIAHAPDAKVAASTRPASIFEALKRAFKLSAKQQAALHEPLRIVFLLRDQAVHPPAEWVQPALHPAFNFGIDPRFVNYRAENAVNAHRLAHKLIHVCLRQPKAKHAALVEWCEAVRGTVDEPPPIPDWAATPETPPAS
jgi:hypothetical protein